jgi:uncharacterized membrane protein
MVIWGAIWGGLFGLLGGGYFAYGFGIAGGAVFGALIGLTLRNAVDKRIAEQMKKAGASAQRPVPVAATEPQPAAARPAPRATVAPPSLDIDLSPAPATIPAARPATAAPMQPAAAPVPRPAPKPAGPSVLDEVIARAKSWLLGGNTVARAGALLLFIGLAFLARYAVERNLLPPQLRLAGIGLVAIVLLVIGFRLRERRAGYALTLQGAGVAILYLTLFAAFRLYGFLPASAAFAMMVAVCAGSAVLAVLQDSRALAVIGVAGGFLAPILASTGQGDHLLLFSYYTVLNFGILAVAWFKDWRLLNVVGFVFTFGIATAWGVLRYRPEHFASTQPFLALFFVLYVLIAVLFARRRATHLADYVDATLVFGVPLVGFGLQAALVREFEYGLAWSAVAVAAFYLLLSALLLRRTQSYRLLAESFVALGVIFASLAIPLALDARWTAAAWALEGAAMVWVGLRQQRRLARAFGLLLLLGGGLAFVDHLQSRMPQVWPVINADFLGAGLLAASAMFVARQFALRHGEPGPTMRADYDAFEQWLAPPLFLYGFAWWLGALLFELTRTTFGPTGTAVPVFAAADRLLPMSTAFAVSAAAACAYGVQRNWPAATWPAYTVAPALLAVAVIGAMEFRHLFEHFGWVCWPLAIASHLFVLARIDRREPGRWFVAAHAMGVYLLALLAGSLAVDLIDRAQLWRTSWGPAATLTLLAAMLVGIGVLAWADFARKHWPMNRFARAYGWYGLLPVAALLFVGALLAAITQRGDAAPLPHLPILNPTDLSVLLALAACWHWREGLQRLAEHWPEWFGNRGYALATVGAALFIWLNTVWLRVVHHFFGVRWTAARLLDSFLVQAGYALLWTTTALALMVFASRRAVRKPWLVGAGLLAATVLKLFLVDLRNAGGTERIVAFIGVGALMLLVGYLAPLPPQSESARAGASTA